MYNRGEMTRFRGRDAGRFFGNALPLLIAFLPCACGDGAIQTYRVSKAGAPALPAPGAPETPPSTDSLRPRLEPVLSPAGRDLHWKAPGGWEERPASGMRSASFLIPGASGAPAELSVVSLSGPAGGELANVNRWRAQLGLPEIAEKELPGLSRRLRSRAGGLLLVDFSGRKTGGGPPMRLLAAVLSSRDNVWFFKLTGRADSVGAAKESFLDFLKSLHYAH